MGSVGVLIIDLSVVVVDPDHRPSRAYDDAGTERTEFPSEPGGHCVRLGRREHVIDNGGVSTDRVV